MSKRRRAFRQGNGAAGGLKAQRTRQRAHKLFESACEMHRSGRHAEAQAAYREVLALTSELADAYFNLAFLLRESGSGEAALELLERAVLEHPRHPRLASLLGNLYQERLRLDESISMYRAALSLAPDDLSARFNLGKALQKVGDVDAAVESFSELVARNDADAGLWVALGAAHLDAGDAEAALDALDRASALAPDSVDVLNERGLALIDLGRFEDAQTALERAVSIDPRFAQGYLNLARTKRFKTDDFGFESRVLGALRERPIDPSRESDLHFAIAKLYDDMNRVPEAFEHYRLGNEIRHREQPFDVVAHEQFCRRLIERFNAPLFAEIADSRESMAHCDDGADLGSDLGSDLGINQPIFIVGMPRSGTTLVEQILSSHATVRGAGELIHLPRATRAAWLEANQTFYPEGARKPDSALFDAIRKGYFDRLSTGLRAAPRFTDKLPDNFKYLGVIALAFPEARIVHVRRNAEDVCVSNYLRRFMTGHEYSYDQRAVALEYLAYERLMSHWHAVLPGRIFDIDYEALVGDQETMTRALVAACGLEWDDNCLRFHEQQRQVHTASAWQVRQPIYRTAVQRWRRYEAYLEPMLQVLRTR